MSKEWQQRGHSSTRWDPDKALCALCHRRSVATTTSLSSSGGVTIDSARYYFQQAYHNIPICRPCARRQRRHKLLSRITGVLFLLSCIWAFVAAGLAPGLGMSRFLLYPPMVAALAAMAVFGLTNLFHYAIFLYPQQGRIEKWLRSPDMWGLY